MLIHFEQSGGFAGIRLKADVDTDTLPKDQAQALRTLVQEAQLGTAPMGSKLRSRMRDGFEYHIEIEDGGSRQILKLTEENLPAATQRLVKELRRLAISKRKSAG